MENVARNQTPATDSPAKSPAPLIFVMLLTVGVTAYVVSVVVSETEIPDPSPFAQRVLPMPVAAETGPVNAVPATSSATK